MASRYSLTIQVANPSFADRSLGGHLAAVINTPSGQTYAGFGPRNGRLWDSGKFDSYTVQPGEIPPRDYSNVFGHNSHATFTIPISEAQAAAANAEIKRIKHDANYAGGLLGRFAALAGIDLQNPNRPAPPLDDPLPGFYRDDPVQPWTLQRRR
jgi:hypothetical protein